jgi:hypothetical protein
MLYLKRIVPKIQIFVFSFFFLLIYLFIFYIFCHSKRNKFRMTKNNRKQIQHMAVNKGDNVKIDIDRLVSSIEDMMPHDLLVRPKCCIFKTPAILYRHNEKAFIPNAFSIGPLHHDSPNLKATEKIKVEYLQSLVSRSLFPDTMLITLITSIIEVEEEARECYAEAID